MSRVTGIIVLVLALALGTLGSIQGRTEPLTQSVSGDTSTGPFNPNQPHDEPAAVGSRRV